MLDVRKVSGVLLISLIQISKPGFSALSASKQIPGAGFENFEFLGEL